MSEETIKSEFNEAALRMQRIDASKKLLSFMWSNPTGFYQDYDKYGFEIIFSELLNLKTSVWGKFSDKERIELYKKEDSIYFVLEHKPVFMTKTSSSYGGKQTAVGLNHKNWKLLRELLRDFELHLEELYETHGISGRNQEQEEGWD